MPNRRADRVGQPIEVLFEVGTVVGLDDAQLLDRFAAHRDEVAFTALVQRHGPMVLAACRGLLGDAHQADDAFQATFLVLARRAGVIREPDRLGAWLHGVACHAAGKARRSESRRLRREREAAISRVDAGRHAEPTLDREGAEAVHEEIARLPERYRIPIVLCDLQGMPRAEAARRLRWPLGTVNGRLARARDLLRRRLDRRGITPSAGFLVAGASTPGVSGTLAIETVRAAVGFLSQMAGVAGSARGGMLAGKVLGSMMLARSMAVAVVIGTIGLGLLGSAVLVGQVEPRPSRGALPRSEAPRSPLDSLRAADIPASERLPGQPANLVAVLGEHRGRHGGEVRCLAISRDGRTVATAADQDKDIKLWDARTLRLQAQLVGHRSPVRCLAISPDGRTLASGSAYGDFLLWDIGGATPKGPTPLVMSGRGSAGFNNQFHAVGFTPDGKTMAVAGNGKGVVLFDCSGPAPRERGLLPGFADEARTLTFAPDGATLALLVEGDDSVRLWDAGAGFRERAVLRSTAAPGARNDKPVALAFSPDGRTLAVVAAFPGRGVTLWDLSVRQPTKVGRLGAEGGAEPREVGRLFSAPRTITFTPGGRGLLAGQADGSIRRWELTPAGPVERAAFGAHEGSVDRLAFSSDGRTLVTGGADHLIRVWDATGDEPRERVIPQGPVGGLKAIAFAADGATLAVGGGDKVVRLWDLAEAVAPGQPRTPKQQIAAQGPVNALAFSPDGATLAIDAEVWDRAGPEPAFRGLLGDGDDTWSLAYVPDGKTLISGHYGAKIQFWDMGGREPRRRLTVGGDPPGRPPFLVDLAPVPVAGEPAVVAVSPDGKLLASSGEAKGVKLWDLAAGEPREFAVLEGTGWPISALAFAPDSKTLAAGTNAGTLVWDLDRAPPRLVRTIKGCLGFALAFSRDGSRLIAADEVMGSGKPLDPSHPAVCVYEVATGQRLHDWSLSAPCWAIALAPDGRHVAAAKQDGTVDVLRLPPAR